MVLKEIDNAGNGIITSVLEELGLKTPIVKLKKEFKVDGVSDTSLAYVVHNDNEAPIIYIKEGLQLFDVVFALLHEIRHIYQIENNLFDLSTHSLENYNHQIEEVDANAYASLKMREWFSVTPLYIGLSEEEKQLIVARMEQLKQKKY